MTVTRDTFRQALPEFIDAQVYTNDAVDFWLAIAAMMLPVDSWGASSATADVPPTTRMDYGRILFAAHQLVLERQAQRQAVRGALPGSMTGAVSADAAGKVSRSYDTGSVLNPDDGHWNLTTYGIRFAALMRMAATRMVTVGGCAVSPMFSGQPWVGPPPWPGWFG